MKRLLVFALFLFALFCVIAKGRCADTPKPAVQEPVKVGTPVNVTVPPAPAPVVNVTAPEPAPTLADLMTKLAVALVGIWTLFQEIRHQIQTQKATQTAVPPTPSLGAVSNEELLNEFRRRFPQKG